MRGKILLAVVAIVAGVFSATGAGAVTPCPDPACTVLTGSVADPHGNAVPSYKVIVQRADGYNETVTTTRDGRFEFHLPKATPNNCYQIVGQADAYYSNSTTGQKACNSGPVSLTPKYRINGISGYQKVYLGSTDRDVSLPVEVSALSRSYPAPFDGDALPYVFEHHMPEGNGKEMPHEAHAHGDWNGMLPEPTVKKIANGVWQYVWKGSMELPSHMPGFYDMDWGKGSSVFNPMMDCRMVWFGFGTATIAPASALPGSVITLTGQRLGTKAGTVVIKGSGKVSRIDGPSIVSWTDSQVKFVLPPDAKTGWASLVRDGGVATNAQYLKVQP